MPGPVRRIEERLGMRSGPAAPPNPDAPNSPDAAEAATPARGPRTVAPLLPPVGSSGSTAQTQAPARAGAEKASARRTETRTELTVTPAPATDQNSITLRAVVSALGERVGAGRITGQVTFSAGTGESLGVSPLTTENGIASAALMIKLPPGRHQVTASYSGNSRFAGSASGWLSVTVTKTGRLSVHPSQ
ncbi:MAG: Ig-like domain-containing protein [Vicinamibacterales bacterium]